MSEHKVTSVSAEVAESPWGTERPRRTQRREDRRAAWSLLADLMRPYWAKLLLALVLLVCDTAGMLYIPTELAALLNSAVSAQGGSALIDHGTRMLIAAMVGSGGCIASYWVISNLAADVARNLRMRLYEHSLALAASEFGQFGTASMITRTLSDVNVVQQSLVMAFTMAAPVPVVCVVSVILAFGIDPYMGWLLMVVCLVMLAVSVVAVIKSAPIFVKLQGFIDRMNVRLRESVTGTRVVRAFGRESFEQARLDDTFQRYADNAIHVSLVFATVDSATFFIMNMVEALVMWLGANRVGVYAMQIGSISALVEYAMNILFFMMMAQFAMVQLPRALACLNRAQQVLTLEPKIQDPSAAAPLLSDCASERVAALDHVSLRFHDADENTLDDVSFELRRGSTVAIIGNTGSGKSTVAKMLLRFHDATSGTVSVLGRDVRDVRQQDLRSHIAYVPQRAWLFSGTLAENLRDGNADATDAELAHALEVAQADFVKELPDGLESAVAQGGSNFSGGQRQRLAIARALVRKADLYIFDDSFSALDFATDAALRAALSHELTHAAMLIVAQRVNTIKDANTIVVLDKGKVVGKGTHQELMETCEAYQQIVKSQQRGGGM